MLKDSAMPRLLGAMGGEEITFDARLQPYGNQRSRPGDEPIHDHRKPGPCAIEDDPDQPRDLKAPYLGEHIERI
jgi:hypothetical protein